MLSAKGNPKNKNSYVKKNLNNVHKPDISCIRFGLFTVASAVRATVCCLVVIVTAKCYREFSLEHFFNSTYFTKSFQTISQFYMRIPTEFASRCIQKNYTVKIGK